MANEEEENIKLVTLKTKMGSNDANSTLKKIGLYLIFPTLK
jgi:hypothetical protein